MMKFNWILCLFGLLLISTRVSARAAEGDDNADGSESDTEDYLAEENDDHGEEEDLPSHILPIITSRPLDLVVVENDIVELPCKGEHLQHVAMLWYKGADIIVAGELVTSNDPRFSLKDKQTVLVIRNISKADAGEYKCTITANEKESQVVHTIRFLEAPRVSIGDAKNRVVKDGEPVSLACVTSGLPQPAVFWVRKNNKHMPNGELQQEGSEITFSSVSRHHSGVYECVANNSLGTARTAINLIVQHAPEIEIEKESVNSGQGLEAELTCTVHAEPKATVTWYKDGNPADNSKYKSVSRTTHHWMLSIKNVQEEDFGDYTCMANNTLGRDHKKITLSGAPSQPILKDKAQGMDQASYKLVWILESTIPIDSYQLKYRQDEGDWEEVKAVLGEKTQSDHIYQVIHTFPDLTSSSHYEAVLQATNKYGTSLLSKVEKFHINGEFQSLEGESEPSAKGAVGGSSSVSLGSPVMIGLILILCSLMSRHFRLQF